MMTSSFATVTWYTREQATPVISTKVQSATATAESALDTSITVVAQMDAVKNDGLTGSNTNTSTPTPTYTAQPAAAAAAAK